MEAMTLPQQVRKRDGSIVSFDADRIASAVERAAFEVLADTDRAQGIAAKVTRDAVETISRRFEDAIPDIESIQDIVESALVSAGYNQIARSFIIHRQQHSDIRFAKTAMGVMDDLKLPINTMEVLRQRYLMKDENHNILETPSEMFRRVAHNVAMAEDLFNSPYTTEQTEDHFYQMMRDRLFMPNSPTLMNAGTSMGQLSACFVVPVSDSIEGIFTALSNMASIHQTGGGTGFNFSNLRPKNDIVESTKGRASGPVSFMSVFDKATSVIVQGGRRRGANMGILRCDHPDIVDFIEAKTIPGNFSNFNLSVAVTDEFMHAVEHKDTFDLLNPRTGKVTATIKAAPLFDLIVNAAWRTGDPGIVFIDEVNRHNPTPQIGNIEATNPCGELPLLDYESCNLGSINLAQMTADGKVDWQRLADTVTWAVRFLDDVIEANNYPLESIRDITLANRKIGLGVMGFAELLIMLDIPYNSKKAVEFASQLMKFIHEKSIMASSQLADQRGTFPNFERSVYARDGQKLRNATVNTIAPTGTISIIAGCSSGIEPLFAVSFVRNILSHTRLFETNALFEQAAKKHGIYSRQLIAEISAKGSLRNIKSIPEDIKRIFVTAFDIEPAEHLAIQAAFQKYTDNAVSKTINLPHDATCDDVRDIYLMAYKLKCKGITVYRYGTKDQQVLSFAENVVTTLTEPGQSVCARAEYSGGCVAGTCVF